MLLAAAEESRHLEVPAAQRAIGGSLLKRRVEREHLLELVADVAAVFQAAADAVVLRVAAHVRGEPEVAVGLVGRAAMAVRAAAMPAS